MFCSSQLRPEAAYLYDAVWMYARAADKAIRSGQSPSDGRTILNYVKDTTYLSECSVVQPQLFEPCGRHAISSGGTMSASIASMSGIDWSVVTCVANSPLTIDDHKKFV